MNQSAYGDAYRIDSVRCRQRFGAADCSGQPIAGLGVYYVPQPGFHGTDRFDYDASFSNGTEHATVTVTIR